MPRTAPTDQTDDFNLARCVDPMVAQLYCLPILESRFRAVEVLSAEYRPPPAIGLMRYTARLVAAFFAHGQAFGQDGGEVDHGR